MKAYQKRFPRLLKVETIQDNAIALCSEMYRCSDVDERSIKFSCKGIQKQGNDVNYKKFENVLFGDKQDTAHNKGFCYIDGIMKASEQDKKGLSYIYCKRIVLPDGINTIPLNI